MVPDFVGGGKKKTSKKPSSAKPSKKPSTRPRRYRGGEIPEECKDFIKADDAPAAAPAAAADTAAAAPGGPAETAAVTPGGPTPPTVGGPAPGAGGGKARRSRAKKGGADVAGLVTAAALLLGKAAIERQLKQKGSKKAQRGGQLPILGSASVPALLEEVPAAPAPVAPADAVPQTGGKKSRRSQKGGNMCGAGLEALVPAMASMAGGKKKKSSKKQRGGEYEGYEDAAQAESTVPAVAAAPAEPAAPDAQMGGKKKSTKSRKQRGGEFTGIDSGADFAAYGGALSRIASALRRARY